MDEIDQIFNHEGKRFKPKKVYFVDIKFTGHEFEEDGDIYRQFTSSSPLTKEQINHLVGSKFPHGKEMYLVSRINKGIHFYTMILEKPDERDPI